MSNPTNSLALRDFALVLLLSEAHRLGLPDWKQQNCLAPGTQIAHVCVRDFLCV